MTSLTLSLGIQTATGRVESAIPSSDAPAGETIGMTYVDSAVLDLVERLCCRFQVWTGRTNVWLAFQLTNLSVIVYFIWVAGLYWLSGDVALRVFVAFF